MATNKAIVIGGGIAGCSTAYALAQRGLLVTLLERNATIASEASGNPLAMLYPRLSGNDASSKFALTAFKYSLALYQSLGLTADIFQSCGMLQLGFNSREQKRIQQVAQQYAAVTGIALVDAQQASAIAHLQLKHSALHFAEAGWVQPQQLCQRLTQHKNIHINTHTQVDTVIKTANGFEVHISGALLASDLVVIANAGSAGQLVPDMRFNTQSVRGQVSLLSASKNTPSINSIICTDGYFSPAAYQGMHCLGASFAKANLSETQPAELTVELADHLQNLQKLQQISNSLHDELKNNLVGGRASVRCTAADYWPLAGQLLDSRALLAKPPRPSADVNTLPWVEGLYMNIAHGSKGFTTAPLCAEIIACMATQNKPPVDAEIAGLLNPNRFQLKQMGLKRLAKMVRITHER